MSDTVEITIPVDAEAAQALKRETIALRDAHFRAPWTNPIRCYSQEVEDEYRDVLFRPKFDRYVSIERRRRILDIILIAAQTIEPADIVRECSDPKDDKYLTLAAAGHADVIVSSDVHHLLSMHP